MLDDPNFLPWLIIGGIRGVVEYHCQSPEEKFPPFTI
jgi:hypothetical protein